MFNLTLHFKQFLKLMYSNTCSECVVNSLQTFQVNKVTAAETKNNNIPQKKNPNLKEVFVSVVL